MAKFQITLPFSAYKYWLNIISKSKDNEEVIWRCAYYCLIHYCENKERKKEISKSINQSIHKNDNLSYTADFNVWFCCILATIFPCCTRLFLLQAWVAQRMVMWRSANDPRTAIDPQIGPQDPEQKLRNGIDGEVVWIRNWCE